MRIYNAPFKFRRHKLIDSSVLCSNCPVCLSNSHNRTLPWTVHQQLAYRLIFASCMLPHLSRCYEQKQTVQWLWSSFSPPDCCATAAGRAIRSAIYLFSTISVRPSQDLLDRTSPSFQGWQNCGCRWSMWKQFFDSSRDVSTTTNFCWLYPHNWVPVTFGRRR